MKNKIQILEEVLYWLEHTTMSREQIIEIYKEQDFLVTNHWKQLTKNV